MNRAGIIKLSVSLLPDCPWRNRFVLGFLLIFAVADKHGKRGRKLLALMGDAVKAAAKGVSAKVLQPDSLISSQFIAPPLDLNVPIPFEENIATGMPIEQMLQFKDYMVQKPNMNIMCALQHGETQSCAWGSATAFKREFVRAVKLYGPVRSSGRF